MKKVVVAVSLAAVIAAVTDMAPAAAEPTCSATNVGNGICKGKGEAAFTAWRLHEAGGPPSMWTAADELQWARKVCQLRSAGKSESFAAGWVQDAMSNNDGGNHGVHGAESRELAMDAEYTMCAEFATMG